MNTNKKVRIYTKSAQNGQMLLVLLLVMVVGLTIGLFLVGRTTTDISLTNKLTDSSRAFNAAEAGIEEAIQDLGSVVQSSPVPVASGVRYTLTTSALGGTGIYPATPQPPLNVGETFTVWLVEHNEADGSLNELNNYYDNNQLDICILKTSGTDPALEVSLIYRDFDDNNSVKSAFGFDEVPDSGNLPNNIQIDTDISKCPGYTYHIDLRMNNDFGTVNLANDTKYRRIALRLRPVYAPAALAVVPNGISLPKQGNYLDSLGQAGETSRRIEVKNPYVVPAPFMDNAIYSTTSDLSK